MLSRLKNNIFRLCTSFLHEKLSRPSSLLELSRRTGIILLYSYYRGGGGATTPGPGGAEARLRNCITPRRIQCHHNAMFIWPSFECPKAYDLFWSTMLFDWFNVVETGEDCENDNEVGEMSTGRRYEIIKKTMVRRGVKMDSSKVRRTRDPLSL